ncbi:hypothetical protein AVEN_270941-1 [Araneus ventricosus]|uniref:Uncharacterized protein n=1 Tax=Araneus ventricosus TaxID=182803 RepID=A0A4Y2R999_ARAVE|nr:hypothetical protein AVEN_270941-1 [Araneus ventricosus]
MAEIMQFQREDLHFEVKTVIHSLVSDVEDSRRKSLSRDRLMKMISDKLRLLTNLIHIMQKRNFLKVVAVNIKVVISVLWKIVYSNAEMRAKKDSEVKNAENSENKCEAMDTSETLINKNGATNGEPNVAVDKFSLSDELHGTESLPNYGVSLH